MFKNQSKEVNAGAYTKNILGGLGCTFLYMFIHDIIYIIYIFVYNLTYFPENSGKWGEGWTPRTPLYIRAWVNVCLMPWWIILCMNWWLHGTISDVFIGEGGQGWQFTHSQYLILTEKNDLIITINCLQSENHIINL